VFIVVTFVGVLYNAVQRSPLIFLRLAEAQVGEMDMLITPYAPNVDALLDLDAQAGVVSKFQFFNATALDRELSTLPTVTGTSPRWLLRGRAASLDAPQTFIDATILICDLEREAELDIGRGWPHRLLRHDEAHVMSSLLYSLDVPANEGRGLRIDIGVGKLLSTFGLDADFLEALLLSSIRADEGVRIQLDGVSIARQLAARGIILPPDVLPAVIETNVPITDVIDMRKLISNSIQGAARGELMTLDYVRVVDSIESTYDKWPRIGNAILMEKKFFLRAVKEAANKVPLLQLLNIAAVANRSNTALEDALVSLDTPVSDQWFDRDMNDYAFGLVVQYKYRLESYIKDAKALLQVRLRGAEQSFSNGSSTVIFYRRFCFELTFGNFHQDMAEFSNQVGQKIGFDSPLNIRLPIAEALKPMNFLRIFLNQIFNSVTFVLIVHGRYCMLYLLYLLYFKHCQIFQFQKHRSMIRIHV